MPTCLPSVPAPTAGRPRPTPRRALLAAALFLALPAAASAQVQAIRAGRVVDPDAGTAAANQVILVEKGRITQIGPAVAIPPGAAVIDLSAYTVLPGLFDAHSHLCQTTPPSNRSLYTEDLLQTGGYRAIQGVANAREMLEAGFTTVRDVGNAGNYLDTDLRRAIERGIVPGPTMINAGRIIAPFGGQYHLNPERRTLGEPEYRYADTHDEMVKAVRENAHFGAKVIKIVVDDQPYIYSPDDIRFIIEEARRAGLKVAAHCMTEQGARNAAEAGVASIEHGFTMSDETIALAKKNNVILVGTDFTVEAARYLGLDEEDAKWFHGRFLDRLKRAYKAGLPMVFGSDAFFAVPGKTRGAIVIQYVDSYTEAGVAPRDFLPMITTRAARLLGVDRERGALKAGLAADIVATRGNPLDDINALKTVVFVMKDGRVVKSAP